MSGETWTQPLAPNPEDILLLRRMQPNLIEETYNMSDSVDHPAHYTAHPSGVECIDIVQHMGFCLGNAIKYIWRADLKGNALEELEKARWYIDQEICKRSQGSDGGAA